MAGETRIRWYEQMLEIRLFEEKVQELFMDGLVEGTTHLCQGQEAVPVGAVSAMREDDYMTITYRGHGHALARGIPIEACFAELMGRTTGCCKGVGGSMHFTDVSKGLLGAFAIVGAGLPVAVGAAHSARLQGRDSVALTFFGDGATNIGTFHEALNLASAWKAPTIFIIENNLYGEFTPMRETTPLDDLADRAKAYAIPGVVVDGQDVEAVHSATSEAIARARAGDGPSLLEMKTYRYRGHSKSDPARYRPDGELDAWKDRDPLTILGKRLADEGHLSESDQAALRETTQRTIDEIADRAQTAPFPTLEETRNYVYAV
jgi:pyruvate dehydrogenase E1 component alpha subunit